MIAAFVFIISLSIFTPLSKADDANDCEKWFLTQRFYTHKNCWKDCQTSKWDDVWHGLCIAQCDNLCEKYKQKNASYPLKAMAAVVKLYPGLSDSEKKIAETEPLKA